jgi:hypothetical protein
MLFRERLGSELAKKLPTLERFFADRSRNIDAYLSALKRLESLDAEQRKCALAGDNGRGAIPGDEFRGRVSFAVPFEVQWQNHEQARSWASNILSQRTTFAADGSQIYAGDETPMPVAAIQIGWFENPHDGNRIYRKDALFELLMPDELFSEAGDDAVNPDAHVEQHRYLGEIAAIGEFVRRHEGWRARGERMPVAFFDNPLIVPFSQKRGQARLVSATHELVALSRDCEVPVVGYVDRSFSRDLMSMLENLVDDGVSREGLVDAELLRGGPGAARVLASWGDRSCFCYSNRTSSGSGDEPAGRPPIGFVYLQTTASSPPARLDIPSWVAESDCLNEVIDVVRAECVVGLGYPYALETADQTAVIGEADRQAFFRALQEFASREKLDLGVSRKNASKQRRR